MKRKVLISAIAGVLLIAIVVAVLLLTAFNKRHFELFLNTELSEDTVVYEDITAEYQYTAKLKVQDRYITENTHIDYAEEVKHVLKIKEYEGVTQTLGVSVFINGIPQSIRVGDSEGYMFTFDPNETSTFEFAFTPTACSGKEDKVSVVIVAEMDSQPIYYLDSVSNYTNAITYWIDHAPEQQTPVLQELSSSKNEQAVEILAENTSCCAVISDEPGLTTEKFIARDALHTLYLNLYGKEGRYLVTSYCNDEIYNAFGEASSVVVDLKQNELASIEMQLPDESDDMMRNVYCIIIPESRSDISVYDSVVLNLIHDSQMIRDANSLGIQWSVESEDSLVDEKLEICLKPQITSVKRTFRLLALIDGIP